MSDHSPIATIDHLRRSVSVPRHLMPSILAIHTGRQLGSEAGVAELSAGGIMSDGRLDPMVTTLVGIMTNPSLVITVETVEQTQLRLATYWGTPHRAAVGLTDDRRRFELIQIEPTLLPFHLAQSTGISPQPHPPFHGGFSVSAKTLQYAEDSISTDPAGTEQALKADGIAEDWADRLMTALAMRRSIWTVESVWLGRGARRRESRLSVLDAGYAGYWELAASEGRVAISTIDFDEILHRLADLLPAVGPATD